MTTAAFFRSGAETPFVQGVKSEKYPYSVSRNSDVAAPTLDDAELLLTSAHIETLQKRVQLDVHTPNAAIVDKYFRVRHKDDAPRDLAVETWNHLFWNCKIIQLVSGIFAGGFTLLALQGPRFYTVVAFYVGAVASACLFGWCLNRYYIAKKQLAVWQSPGEDFATKRKAALQLSLQAMIQKKCHFCPEQLTGTLLGVEMLSVFRRDFKKFATPLLARKCETPQQQHQWVADFFYGNPFAIKFFEENPHLASERGWEDVQKFQKQTDQSLVLINTLKESHGDQFKKNQDAAKLKANALQKEVSEKAKAFCEGKKIVSLRTQLYLSRVLKILKTECLDKIYDLGLREKAKADFVQSLVYPQVRALLEEAQKGLLEDKPYVLDENGFTDPEKFVSGNFQEELDAITVPYPQNVIEKSKAIADAMPLYQQFVDAAFA
jgi:hypothetical protein